MLWSNKSTSAARKPTRPALEKLEAREVLYAVTGNAWIRPELISIGFVPDGTQLGAYTSNLQSTFDNHASSTFRSTWRSTILKAAQVWAQQTNINFVLVSDNGTSIGSGAYQQGDPAMADIRIGGYNFGASVSTLAQSYSPAAANLTSSSGDMQFNTGQTWNMGTTYDLFTVAMHEFGHALGLEHGASGTVMQAGYTSTKTGLTSDDVNGIRAVVGWTANGFSSPGYGGARAQDAYDGGAGNGSFATASNVTSQINTSAKTALLQNLDITTTSTTTDNDYFKFTAPSGLGGTLTVKAQSSGLSLLAPQLALFNSAQGSLTSATAGMDYDGATPTLSYSVTAGQTYYVKVTGANTTAHGSGKYALALGFVSTAAPLAAAPITTTATGSNVNTGGGTNTAPPLLQMTGESGPHGYGPEGCSDHDHAGHSHDDDHATHESDEAQSPLPGQLLNSLLAGANHNIQASALEQPSQHQGGQDHALVLPPDAGLRPSRDGQGLFAAPAHGIKAQATVGEPFCISAPAFAGGCQWLSPLTW